MEIKVGLPTPNATSWRCMPAPLWLAQDRWIKSSPPASTLPTPPALTIVSSCAPQRRCALGRQVVQRRGCLHAWPRPICAALDELLEGQGATLGCGGRIRGFAQMRGHRGYGGIEYGSIGRPEWRADDHELGRDSSAQSRR